MYTVVGLGNPGDEYRFTRHNVGWLALETFVRLTQMPSLVTSGTFTSLLSEGVLAGEDVGVILPTTYMNNSGSSVVRYLTARKGSTERVIVVHDEADLPLGTIRISVGRNGGGHNGVQSVIAALSTPEFIRVRIGIAQTGFFGKVKRPTGEKLAAFVLGQFSAGERKQLDAVCEKAAAAIRLIIEKGPAYAMNAMN
jgi:peptidyl-tRNA hydrolase, PTH1 family